MSSSPAIMRSRWTCRSPTGRRARRTRRRRCRPRRPLAPRSRTVVLAGPVDGQAGHRMDLLIAAAGLPLVLGPHSRGKPPHRQRRTYDLSSRKKRNTKVAENRRAAASLSARYGQLPRRFLSVPAGRAGADALEPDTIKAYLRGTETMN